MREKNKLAAVVIIAIIICNYMIVPEWESWLREDAMLVEKVHSLDEIPFWEAGKKTEGSLCVVRSAESPSYEVIFGEYIYLERYFKEMKFPPDDKEEYLWKFERYSTWDRRQSRDGEIKNWIVDFFNYRTGELEKSLDLVDIEAANTLGKQHDKDYSVFSTDIVDGKRYLYWNVRAVRPGYFDTEETLVYDFDQDKTVDGVTLPQSRYTDRTKEFIKSSYILCDEENCNFLKINHMTPIGSGIYVEDGAVRIRYNDLETGIIEVSILASKLPKENTKLYQEFPELKNYNAKEDDIVDLYFAGYPDAEEVMRMLLEEGTEITYEGCVLSGENSIDGENHKISCMDNIGSHNFGKKKV